MLISEKKELAQKINLLLKEIDNLEKTEQVLTKEIDERIQNMKVKIVK